MKSIKVITLSLLTVLTAGCAKEDFSRLRISTEAMSDGAKVWVNPSAVSNSATWLAGEQIDINGVAYTITQSDGDFYLNDIPTDGMRYAVYPATTGAGGNNVTVTNNGASGATVLLRRLALNFHDGGHDILFPMAARTAADADTLRFHHLTGGFRLTLASTTATMLHTLKVVVQGTSEAPAVTINGISYTTRWEVQGPTMPDDAVGQSTGNVEVMYSSEMHFAMQTEGVAGVTIPAGGSTSFCLPVTVATVRRLTVSGYSENGALLFVATKELANIAVNRNNMYNIPTIQIN